MITAVAAIQRLQDRHQTRVELNPNVLTTITPAQGAERISLVAPEGSTLSFIPVTSFVGSGVDMELKLNGSVVAVISFPSDYLNPLKLFNYYHAPNTTTYRGAFSNTFLELIS